MEEALKELFPVRSDFNPLAFYEPAGETDESGIYRASWNVPDTIGRYRVVAMASSGARYFGCRIVPMRFACRCRCGPSGPVS